MGWLAFEDCLRHCNPLVGKLGTPRPALRSAVGRFAGSGPASTMLPNLAPFRSRRRFLPNPSPVYDTVFHPLLERGERSRARCSPDPADPPGPPLPSARLPAALALRRGFAFFGPIGCFLLLEFFSAWFLLPWVMDFTYALSFLPKKRTGGLRTGQTRRVIILE